MTYTIEKLVHEPHFPKLSTLLKLIEPVSRSRTLNMTKMRFASDQKWLVKSPPIHFYDCMGVISYLLTYLLTYLLKSFPVKLKRQSGATLG